MSDQAGSALALIDDRLGKLEALMKEGPAEVVAERFTTWKEATASLLRQTVTDSIAQRFERARAVRRMPAFGRPSPPSFLGDAAEARAFLLALKRDIETDASTVLRQGVVLPIDELDVQCMRQAIDLSQLCQSEPGRVSPNVGAVVAQSGQVLAAGYRGEESPGEHAEFTVLERKLVDHVVAGATIYTTLEPCTTRNHPKVPCADRLVERKVARVVVGMLDPNPTIQGDGVRILRDHNVRVDLFPPEFGAQVEDINRHFTRAVRTASAPSQVPSARSPGDEVQEPFARLERLMPALLDEMRRDLAEHPLFREFVVFKKGLSYWAKGNELVYHPDEHPDLASKLQILENHGLITEITYNNTPRYLMSEALARYLGAD